MQEKAYIDELIKTSLKLGKLGYCHGSSGNISIRTVSGIYVSASGSRLSELNEDSITLISPDGTVLSGRKPTKEVPFHIAIYESDPSCGAVIHLHTTYSGVVSCMGENFTAHLCRYIPYLTMKIGKIGFVPYYKPGSPELGRIMASMPECGAYILSNHGMVVKGKDIQIAADNVEELEYSLQISWLLRNEKSRLLSDEELGELV